ncbi:MAG: 3-ketoacyl-ACP reductase [Fibrobacterota bacterium]|nr:3-ketoacyl-ACP reductase [Fibrobacterota bacterium]
MSHRVAAITGGGRGIGLGISTSLAKEGFDLALCGQRDEKDVESLEGLRKLGVQVLYTKADVADARQREAFLAAVKERFGRLDVLVNNAGIAPKVRADILDASEESFDELIKVNLRGPYFLTQKAAQWMIAQKQDDPSRIQSVINITSISATVASVNRGDYCLAKAALGMSNQLWSVRLAEFGIPVYEVRPGVIKTDMTAGVTGKYDALIANGLVPQNRWGFPEDVGKAVAMLARGDLPYSTGQVIMVDGGLTLSRL